MLNFSLALIILILNVVTLTLLLINGRSRPPRPPSRNETDQTILVKRTRPNFRHVSQKPRVEYQEYRTKNGLYGPLRPGKQDDPDGVEIGGGKKR